ncbi:zinc finger protein 585A-like [Culex pipiens pallens]|uniref:zinc finger protein 585A-like n=1 Tax=Culex pipiens pallens TaxID=42434 RepID=UPI0022AA754E|nr:zinc finger protein 585A-like [Culex pipiens pallens]XP_039450810.2 zinc finger protein 585A-like [Culex pipiens pallens]
MATEIFSEELHQTHVFTVVKEEPPEIDPGAASFCYETVIKEEVILEDPVERADDLPEPTEIPKEHPFKCFECYRTFAIENNLKKCLKRHHAIRNKLYKCKFCGKCCGTKQDNDRHKRSHKRNLKKLKPPVQDIEINKQKQPESVSESPSGNSTEISKSHRFKCSECSKTFDKKHLRQRCEWKHKVIKSERYKCETCGKLCCSKFNLTRHEFTHKNEQQQPKSGGDLPSSEEKNSMTPNEDSNENESEESDESSENCYKCPECPRRFKERYQANRCKKQHLAKRLGLTECKLCKKQLGTIRDLKNHELTHSRVKTPVVKPAYFACEICDKRYVKKESIKKHMLTHQEGALLFKCHTCNVKFPTRAEMLTHITRHDWNETKHSYAAKLVKEDDGNYLCTVCSRRFINLRTGIPHVFRHMNIIEALFECKSCGLRCGDAYEYKIHIQTHKKPEEATDASDGKPPAEEPDSTSSKESAATQKSTQLDCRTCRKRLRNQQSLERHEIIHRIRKKRTDDVAEPEQAAEEGNKTEETGASFCYETVTKEELIIEDDAVEESGKDEGQEEVPRNSLEGSQVKEDETGRGQEEDSRESLKEQSEPKEGELPNKETPGQVIPKQCDICQKIFTNRRNAASHRQSHEKSEIPLECRKCHEKFDTRYSLLAHHKTHANDEVKSKYKYLMVEDEEGHRCLLCETRFSTRSKLFAHVQRHMNVIEGVYHCKVCGLRCGENYDYQLHIKTHKNMSNQKALPREIEGVHTDYDSSSKVACEKSDLPLHCKTCNVFFNNKTNLNVHLWKSKLRFLELNNTTHEKEPPVGKKKPVVPKVKSQPTQRGLRIRKSRSKTIRLLPRDDSKIFTDENGFYNCTKCDYKTVKSKLFRGHVRGHKAVEVGLYTCEVCQMRLPDKEHLFCHKKTHLKERFECLTCHQKFATKKDLFKHRIIHTKNVITKQFMEKVTEDEKGVFTCSICGKTHTERKYAFAHFRTHVTEKFVCQICEKRCASKNILIQHIESQHEKLRFRCSTCKERFETRPALFRHKQEHKSDLKVILQKDDRYRCTRCDKTYARRDNALLHFKSHSKNKNKSDEELQIKEDNATEEDRDSRENSLNNEELDS